ncbi:MAG TPA: alpha/beta hydrolase [Myxococcales bacterium]
MPTLLLPGMDGTGDLLGSFGRCLPFEIAPESFSGPLGVMIAARYPPRVVALVLVAGFVSDPTRVAARLAAALAPALILPPPAWIIRRTLLGSDAPPREVASARAAIRRVKPSVLSRRLKEVATVDASALLARTTLPLLYVRASGDRLVTAREARRVAALRPDATVRIIDAPHSVLQSRPQAAAALIGEFLRRHLCTATTS